MTNRAWKTSKVTLVGLIAVFVAAGLGVAVAARAAGFGASQASDPPVSILTRAASPADAVPTSVLESPLASHLASISAVRFAGTFGDSKVYVGPGTKGTFCLIVTTSTETYGDCANRSLLATGAIYLSRVHSDGTSDVFGLVDDSGTNATSGPTRAGVTNNVFELANLPGTSIDLSHDDGSSTTIDIGPQSRQ